MRRELDSSNIFDLIDPMNFRLDLSSNSKIIVNDNNYDLMFLGDVYINSDVKTSDDSQYRFYFGYPTPESQHQYGIIVQTQVGPGCQKAPQNWSED